MSSSLIDIARTGLQVSQYQLSTTGNNISNANTPGYSRQQVNVTTQAELNTGGGYLGSGAQAVNIERIANQFVTEQVWSNSSAFNQVDIYSNKLSQLDNLLATESSGLSTTFNDFYSSMATAADDPSSLPARESVLSQLNIMTQRFNSLDTTIENMYQTMDAELSSFSGQINILANGIATLNQQILENTQAGSAPNSLLDQRDEMVRALSELVTVNVVTQGDGAVNIYIGNGQGLVVSDSVNSLSVVAGQAGSDSAELVFDNGRNQSVVTDDITGGKMGGLLDYRKNVLDPVRNELGQLAITFADSMNTLQAGGLDLSGHYGGNIFVDINDRSATLARVAYSSQNSSPRDRVVSVEITDTDLLTAEDFSLKLNGARPDTYELSSSDGTILQTGSLSEQRPFEIEYQGIRINLESGNFSQGDEFTIMPVRTGAENIVLTGLKAESLAFAQPVVTATGDSNIGTGSVSKGEVIGVVDPITGERLAAFANEGKLGPPLLVRFTSETTYDVLDNTDPANPKSLNPPLENLSFTPGQTNQILPGDSGQTIVVSDGYNAGRIPSHYEILNGGIGTEAPSSIAQEQLTLSLTLANGIQQNSAITIPAGASASDAAYLLSQSPGVSATASSYAEFAVTDDGAGESFQFILNGKQLTLAQTDSLGPLPSPMTNDYLAAAINHDGNLQAQGIRAVSDGNSVKVYSSLGADLKFQVQGDSASDFVEFKGTEPASAAGIVDLNAGVNLNAGGPNTFIIDVFDGPGGVSHPRTVELEGSFSDPDLLVQHIQHQIDKAYGESGQVVVSQNLDGSLRLDSADSDLSAKIRISGPLGADPLGLTEMVAKGTIRPADILTVEGAGISTDVNAITIAGSLSLTLEEGYSLSSNAAAQGNYFSKTPDSQSAYLGYAISVDGNPGVGDEFYVNFNDAASGDNRNAQAFLDTRLAATVGAKASFSNAYNQLVQRVASDTYEASSNRSAAAVVLAQSVDQRNSISAVSLDEEAANLIKFEQLFQASSQVISVARQLFDTLLGLSN